MRHRKKFGPNCSGARRCPVPHVWDGDCRLGLAEAAAQEALACAGPFWRWAGKPQETAKGAGLVLRMWREHCA